MNTHSKMNEKIKFIFLELFLTKKKDINKSIKDTQYIILIAILSYPPNLIITFTYLKNKKKDYLAFNPFTPFNPLAPFIPLKLFNIFVSNERIFFIFSL